MQTSAPAAGKTWQLWNHYFILIIFVSLFSGFCNQFFNSTISLHVDAMHMQAVNTGLLMAGFTLSATAFRVVSGRLCDAGQRRSIVILGLLVFMAASLACGFTASFLALLLCRILQGAGFATCGTAVAVAVADVVPKQKLGEGIGYYGLGTSLTSAIGPSIALALFRFGAFRAVSLGAVAALGISLVLMLFCRYERDPAFPGNRLGQTQDKPAKAAKKNRGIWDLFEKKAIPAATVQFFTCFAQGIVIAFLTLFATKSGFGNVGLFFTLCAITTVIARLVTGKLTDRLGPLVSLVPGYVCGIAAFLLLILSQQHELLYYIAGVLYGFFGGLTAPALNATAINASPADRKGAASATFQAPMEVAFTVSSIAGGVVIDAFGSYTVLFVVSSAFAALALVLSFLFFLPRRRA